jgi:serine/threonine-protein kinase
LLAAAVADGTPIDWDAAESSAASDSERRQIRQMRLVEQLGAAQELAPPATPSTWGSLRILENIGQGRFGDVYRAFDPRLDREVALKLLRPRAASDPAEASLAIDEGRMLAKVRHPNVVTVFGADRIDGRVGVWMELIRGRTLEQELQARGPLLADEVLAIGRDVCAALDAVHDAGLVHRDVKAQNVMRDSTGRVVLMDFGTGREHAVGGPDELAGTPLYLAPEVVNGGRATPQADVYSVGVLLHHLATGSFPVTGATLGAIRSAHAGARDPAADAAAQLPSELRATVVRALARDPGRRYRSIGDLGTALASSLGVTAPRPTRAGPVLIVVTTVAAVLAILLAGTATRQRAGDARFMICERCGGNFEALSRDGRFLMFVSEQNDVVVRDLIDNHITPLAVKSHDQPGLPRNPLFSPDGRQIAFAWFPTAGNDRDVLDEVRVRQREGTGTGRTFFVNRSGMDLFPLAWVRDGRILAAFYSDDRSWSLGWLTSGESAPRIVKSFDWRFQPGRDRISVSPRGDWIAYSALAVNPPRSWPFRPRATDRHLYLIQSDGRGETQLTHSAGIHSSPVWNWDGNRILYSSDAAGTVDLWALDIREGAVAGTPVMLQKDIGELTGLGLDEQGRYYYYLSRPGVARSHVVRIDGTPVKTVIGSFPMWSPDGTQIAVMRPRPSEPDTRTVVVHTVVTGRERAYSHSGFDGLPPMWYPDGRGILKLTSHEDGQYWSRLDLDTGEVSKVMPNRGGQPPVPTHMNVRALGADGRTMFFGVYRSLKTGPIDRLMAADTTAGTYRHLLTFPGGDDAQPSAAQALTIAPSPDGRWLASARYDASIDRTRLAIVGTDGQNYRELCDPFAGAFPRNKLAWSGDSRFIYYTVTLAPDRYQITRIAVAGGAPEPTPVIVPNLMSFDINPTGTIVAYQALGEGGSRSEIWSIDLERLGARDR